VTLSSRGATSRSGRRHRILAADEGLGARDLAVAQRHQPVHPALRHRAVRLDDVQRAGDADLAAELAELIRAAQRANVTYYPIDPRGLVAGPPINANVSMQGFQNQANTSVNSLKVLAEQTGGLCICQTNDFARGLARIDDAMSDYYLIGYVPTNTDQKQIRRRIEIRVNRPNVTVSGYKTEYTIKR